ncbi:hypothetical protein AVDCRST_MAG81-1705 [uncultured Synechococcales cyanobacterium]|uniref:Uncharacterized protein n=1 Tax=uncultured Synechococcales cyanobacterium TaxID=1936017 RepID=A0A6J4V8N2_9CYAN|nr:hypothetical protein AVDCRST_MAG81-1705 [uncultured Synechococcales cyanobacterium]
MLHLSLVMPKRITLAEHLSVDELEQRYRQAQAGTQRSHYRAHLISM